MGKTAFLVNYENWQRPRVYKNKAHAFSVLSLYNMLTCPRSAFDTEDEWHEALIDKGFTWAEVDLY